MLTRPAEEFPDDDQPSIICARCGLHRDNHRQVERADGLHYLCQETVTVDESPLDADRVEISREALEALASWDRTLANAERQHRAMLFTRAATEVLRLAEPGSTPAAWQQLVDDLHGMGQRYALSDEVVQTLMTAATQNPIDRLTFTGSKLPVANSPDDYGLEQSQLATLSTICPPAWRDIPLEPMRWLATNRIPATEPTILGGDGGGGKTTVALQLAVSVERGLGDWLGTTCETGPVIFFSAEEPEPEMRRRLVRVARKRGLDAADVERLHFHFADPDRCLLGVSQPNGTMAPTPLFEALHAAAIDIRPALIVVDSIAATFGGNQNDRVQARMFVSMFRRLARDAGCAVLLLDHPSLSGMTNGTGRAGSMDWNNAVRARLHLRSVDDQDGLGGRELEVMKSNYGPAREKISLQWEDGCFVLQSSTPAPALAAVFNAADRTYLACLDRLTEQGREVREHSGRGYAPKMFADMPEANGITARAFKAAQDRLFSAGLIHVITEGPASKPTRRIARKPPELIREATT